MESEFQRVEHMTDEEYFKLLKRIVKGAEYLENPLIKKEDYEKGMKLYDKLCELVENHKSETRRDGQREKGNSAHHSNETGAGSRIKKSD
jgi:hypothetical protein